jgi:hypothetical protein
MENAAAVNSDTITPGATNTWVGWAPMSVCTSGTAYANTTQTDDINTSKVDCVPLGGQFTGMGQGIGLQLLLNQTPEECSFRSNDATFNMNTTGIPNIITANTNQFTMPNGNVLGGMCASQSGHTFVGAGYSFHDQLFIYIGYPGKLSLAQCLWLQSQCTNQADCGC